MGSTIQVVHANQVFPGSLTTPKKNIKRETNLFSKILFFGGFPVSQKIYFCLGPFFKMDFRRRPFNQKPLALGEIQKPIWRYFVMKLPSNLPSNVEKWTFRCHVRPNPAKVRDNVFVCSVPPPWTPPDLPNFNLNCEKNSFCEKVDFQFVVSFWAFLGPIEPRLVFKHLSRRSSGFLPW